jgi:predicted phosphohydrolase
MTVWAIADLHLSFGCPDKGMDIFGPEWSRHYEKIQQFWDAYVQDEDLVLIPGDISWAMRLVEAQADLEWISKRPGTKVMIKGNHDHWWASTNKVRSILPPRMHVIWNDVFHWRDIVVGGARLWDTAELDFSPIIEMKPKPGVKSEAAKEFSVQDDKKIFDRELLRLQASLQAMQPDTALKIVMTHFPPIGWDLQESQAVPLLEKAKIQHVVFGHLHSVKKGSVIFGTKAGITYHLASADWLNFTLLKIVDNGY